MQRQCQFRCAPVTEKAPDTSFPIIIFAGSDEFGHFVLQVIICPIATAVVATDCPRQLEASDIPGAAHFKREQLRFVSRRRRKELAQRRSVIREMKKEKSRPVFLDRPTS